MLRFFHIDHQGLWFDEANTAWLVHFSPGKMLGHLPERETTPPLYFCVAWVWSRIFGHGEAGLRSLSAIVGVATVPVAYGAGAKLISRRTGLVIAALTACNPFLIWYSQEVRSYSLLVFLTAVSLLAFAFAREQPTPGRLAAWALAAALALATHYYALIAIVPQAVWLLALHHRERSVKLALAAVGACGLALLQLAIGQQGNGHASWIAPMPLDLRVGQIAPQFLIGTGAPAAGWLKLAGYLAVALAAALLVWRSDRDERRGARVAGGVLVGGVALMLLLVAVGVDDLITRNVIVLWLPLALVVAAGLGARRAGYIGLGGVAVLCGIGLAATVGVVVDRKLQRPDWRPVARAIGARPPAGAAAGRAILVQHYRTLLPLSLYLPGLNYVQRPGAVVNELVVVAIRSPRDAFCWWGAACNLTPSELQTAYPIPGFHVTGAVIRVNQFSIMRLRSSAPVHLTPRIVSRALRTTTLRRDELLVQPPG
jgi:hypothetical protein